VFCLLGCEVILGSPEVGLGETRRTGGPTVVWDALAQPLPELPLPNDAATRLDPTSPTGRRLNVSLAATTQYERDTRARFDTYDGFGTYAPITVRFDAPLDVLDLKARFADDDFRDDPVFVLNVDPDCARYGEEVALDMGRGRFPVALFSRGRRTPDPEAPDGYREAGGNILFPLDARAAANNMVFEEFDEDRNGNGRLDPLEDEDFDGVLDRPNFDDPTACEGLTVGTPEYDRCAVDHLMTFYERETDTLILRPLWPLESGCTYAVVLTNRLVDEAGRAVTSPFEYVQPREQSRALEPVRALLPRYGLTARDVTFAWTFTTGLPMAALDALRAGLRGHGPFARLADEFPPTDWRLWRRGELAPEDAVEGLGAAAAASRVVPGACAGAAISRFWQMRGEWAPNLCAIEADMATLGVLFGGTFAAPNLLVDRDGVGTERVPADSDESWDVDPFSGTGTWGRTNVTFWCALPEERVTDCAPGNPEGVPFCKPFPTILYGHGYGGSRIEPIVSHVGRTTAMGSALCALDSYGHGLEVIAEAVRGGDVPPVADASLFRLAAGVFRQYGVPDLPQLMLRGRDRDLNNDGLRDSGADMWTADLFHTRDMVRQTAFEHMRFVQMLRSMDGRLRDADGVFGDVDGDGRVDLGGPKGVIGAWGISLGGIIAGVLAGAEPGLDAVSPNAGGGGLVDIAARSSQAGVPDAVDLPMMGQLVGGCLPTDAHQTPLSAGESADDCFRSGDALGEPVPAGTLRLALYAQDNARAGLYEFARVPGVAIGDHVHLRNLRNGEERRGFVTRRGYFRLGVPSDALDAIERRSVLGLDDETLGPFDLPDPTAVADPLEVVVYDGDGARVKARVATFEREVVFQGSRYAEGQALVALQRGLGFQRNSWQFRRFMGLAQHGIGPADPAVWAARTFLEPVPHDYDSTWRPGRTRVLDMPTAGDPQVPVNTGISMARARGVLGSWLRDPARPPEEGWRELFAVDDRYAVSPDQYLVDRFVYEGVGRLQRYGDNPVNPNVIFDVDDVSDGTATWSCGPSDWSGPSENGCPEEVVGQEVFFGVPHPPAGEALRHDRKRSPEDPAHDALRVPVLRPAGQHGIYNAQPFRAFDADAFMVNFTTRFLGTAGRNVRHEAGCDCSASAPGAYTLAGAPHAPVGRACTADALRVCSPECASAWGIETAPAACGE
jgi:hypothetical protein